MAEQGGALGKLALLTVALGQVALRKAGRTRGA